MTLCQYEHQILTLCRGRSRISQKNYMKVKKFGLREVHASKILVCKSTTALFLPVSVLHLVSACTYSCSLHLFMALHQYFPLLLLEPFTPTCTLLISASFLSSHPLVTQSHYFFIVYFMSIS